MKNAIMLHSFSQGFMRGRMTLEDVFAQASTIDAEYVEVVAPQMVERHPNPTEEWVSYFRGLMDGAGLEPSCYSIYIDSGRWKGRFLTEAERFTGTLNEMTVAKRLGFPIVRSQDALLPSTMEKLLPYAEALGVHLAIEMHGPWAPTTPIFQEYYELFERAQSEFIGVVPDFSSFTSGAPAIALNKWEDICHRPLLEEINHLYATTEIPEAELEARILSDGGDEIDVEIARRVLFNQVTEGVKMGTPYLRTHPDFDGFRAFLRYTRNLHAKFIYVDDELHSPGTDFHRLVGIMREEGYDGFVASEYEGSFFDPTIDEVGQIRRHIRMMRRLWTEV